MGSAASVTVMGYDPAGLDEVAVVLTVGGTVKVSRVSPSTNPVPMQVSAGNGDPATMLWLVAVIVRLCARTRGGSTVNTSLGSPTGCI